MSIGVKRNIVLPLLFLGVAGLMVQCTAVSVPNQHANGLTCQSYTSSSSEGLGAVKGADCRFRCPDGRVLSLPEAVVSQTRDQLNFLFCGVPMPASASGLNAPGAGAVVPTPTFMPPLSRFIESCDLNKHVINFSFTEPAQALTGKTISVEIQGQPVQCSVPAGYPGIYSCNLAPHTSFPAGIVVRVNQQIVDFFAYSGGVCQYGQATRIPAIAFSSSVPPTRPAATPQPPPPRPTKEPPPTKEPKPTHQSKPTKGP